MLVESAESDASSVGKFPQRSSQSVKVKPNGKFPIDLVKALEATLTSGQALLLFIVLFAKNCTNQIKSNYLNSHGEEAQEKPRAYKEWAPSVR